MKRALFIGNFLSGANGSRGVCEDLVARLRDVGWRIQCSSAKAGRAARLAGMTWATWSKRHDYTVAHVDVFSGFAFRWAQLVCGLLRRMRKPHVVTLRGGNLPAFATTHPSRVSRLLGTAEAVTAPSQYLADAMAAYCRHIQLIPNPIDLHRYHFAPRNDVRPRLIWLRAFHSIYNPNLAVRVACQLAQTFSETSLTMVGPDRGDGSLAATVGLARELRVFERCALSGGVPKEEVPRWLNRGDIFLNTTNVDNTPVSVLEAMACGLCVVSTDVGGIPYLVEHERDALLVPPDDANAMSRAVQRILVEPGLAERLSRNARAKAELHDWSTILPRWDSLLSSLAGTGCR